MKNLFRQNNQSTEYELKTEVLERKTGYWTGRIHRADGSIVEVEVSNLEKLMEKYKAQNQETTQKA